MSIRSALNAVRWFLVDYWRGLPVILQWCARVVAVGAAVLLLYALITHTL